jgi:hypothetical protein
VAAISRQNSHEGFHALESHLGEIRRKIRELERLKFWRERCRKSLRERGGIGAEPVFKDIGEFVKFNGLAGEIWGATTAAMAFRRAEEQILSTLARIRPDDLADDEGGDEEGEGGGDLLRIPSPRGERGGLKTICEEVCALDENLTNGAAGAFGAGGGGVAAEGDVRAQHADLLKNGPGWTLERWVDRVKAVEDLSFAPPPPEKD